MMNDSRFNRIRGFGQNGDQAIQRLGIAAPLFVPKGILDANSSVSGKQDMLMRSNVGDQSSITKGAVSGYTILHAKNNPSNVSLNNESAMDFTRQLINEL